MNKNLTGMIVGGRLKNISSVSDNCASDCELQRFDHLAILLSESYITYIHNFEEKKQNALNSYSFEG
jgi:hypothetical protein